MNWPLGILARSRRDWALNAQAWAFNASESANAGGPQISLNNNDQQGRTLACYAIVPFTGTYPQVVQVLIWHRVDTTNAQPGQPVYLTNPSISGTVSALNRVDANLGQPALVLKADGTPFMSTDGSPLFLIPPGYQLICYVYNPAITNLLSGYLSCSYLWGYW